MRKVIDVADASGERYLRDVCHEARVDVEEAGVRTADAIMMLVIIGVPAALSFVLERWHDRLRGGQIIDLRPGAEQVARRDPGLVYGLVIVHAVDGTATIRIHEPKSQTLELVQAVIAALGGLVGAGIDTVRAKATEALGDQASITCGGAEAAGTDPAGP